MRTAFLSILTMIMLFGGPAGAQMFGRRAPKGATPPKALFVILLTRQNQREYLKKTRPELLPEFERDVSEVARRTVIDYSKHFRYCPVYFFIDSNANKVATGDWEGVLLDSSLQPARNPVVRPGSKDFFIAHFGSPIPQPDSVRAASTGDLNASLEMYGDDPSALFREKLIVSDADFRLLGRLVGPRTNYVRALRPSGMNSNQYREYRKEITYNAKRWFIDYMPTAYSYDATLRTFFRQ